MTLVGHNGWLAAGFILWSSAIVLAIGLVHLVGVWRGWADLKGAQ